MNEAGKGSGRPSWKTILEKALWTAVVAPPLVPVIYLGAIGIYLLVSGRLQDLASHLPDPATLYVILFVFPAGSYLIGLLPALVTGAILGWLLPRVASSWRRAALAIVTGAVSTIPMGLLWNNPPPMRSPLPDFAAIGAISALLTLPILHRRKNDGLAKSEG